MNSLAETVCLKRWQLFVLIAMTGFAVGSLLAKASTAMGV